MIDHVKIASFFLIKILLVVFSVSALAQEKVLPVDSASEYPVHQFATYYCDENFYSINIIKSKEDKGYFKPFPKKILNEGFTNKYYWVCLRLHNALPAVNHLVFELPNNTINYTEVFQLKDSQLVSLGYTGEHHQYSFYSSHISVHHFYVDFNLVAQNN